MPDPASGVVAGDASFLDRLGPFVRERIQAEATEWTARADETIFPPGANWTRTGMIVDGIARAYLGAADGRQMTVRYIRPGGTIGNVYPIAGDRAPLGIAAVTDCRVLEFDAKLMLRIIESDPAASLVVMSVLSQRLEDLYATLASSTFGSMRERVAGHLLDLAHPDPASGRVIVRITQQKLADSVGTVREVVARILHAFRDEGLVATTAGSIEILDVGRVAAQVGRWQERSHR